MPMSPKPNDPGVMQPGERLDQSRLQTLLSSTGIGIEVLEAVDSTNARLADRGIPHGLALAAESQQAGRGRRGRTWLSPPGGIYVSLGWHFDSPATGLSALSLVAGLSAAEAVSAHCQVEVRVKWPNDLVIGTEKLGGCLVEASGVGRRPVRAVIGVGLNLQLPDTTAIDQPWTSLRAHCPTVGRNRLLADILVRLAASLEAFDRSGFGAFSDRWRAVDALHGREVMIMEADGGRKTGQAEGVDEAGRLVVEAEDGRQVFSAGEVSVRGK